MAEPNFKKKTDFGDPKLRRQYLSNHPVCEKCGRRPSTGVHHIVNAKANKKIETNGNYLALCWVPCHSGLEELNWWQRVKKGLEIKYEKLSGI